MNKPKDKPQEITACPDWGKGGSYTVDPATGKRTLVERHGQPADDATPPQAPATTTAVKRGD